jgi:hypothetical protein
VKFSKQLIAISAATVLALPAAALASHGKPPPHKGSTGSTGSTGATGTTGSTGSQGTGRCRNPIVNKGYVVSGTFGTTGSFSATKNADGTYTGTVSFTVTRTNHHAAGAKSPFSFTSAKVRFDSPTATAPAATDNVRLIGMIAVARQGCTSTTVGKVTISKIVFSTPTT